MINASPLTNRYQALHKADAGGDDELSSHRAFELDRLYQQIISSPILRPIDAIDKLAFADHCLNVEIDIKEASNLIRQVSLALLVMHHRASDGSANFGSTSESHRRRNSEQRRDVVSEQAKR
jgi:hypothetical protein